MDKDRPDIDSIFLAAIEKPTPEEIAAYLGDVCGDDLKLRKRVERLLEAHEKAAGSFLETPATGLQAAPISGNAQTMDVNPAALEAGLAATFGPEAAVVMGSAAHSVLKSLSKNLPEVPHVTLDEASGEHTEIVQPRSEQIPIKQDDSRYQWLGEIARGGMGAILRGRDTDLGRDLAVKVLLDSHHDKPEMMQRFVEEAQIGGQLQHPGIVPIYELGQFPDQRPYFTMKLVKGETLAALLAGRKDPSEDQPKLLGIFEQICQTMAYAHTKGVIHRDLKPANIMVGAFGEVQVMDWGLSKVLKSGGVVGEQKSLDKHRDVSVVQTRRSTGSDLPGNVGSQTQMGSVMGTPAYMPPEQALGEIDRLDRRADVFGLVAILAEILTGKPPYVAGSGMEIFRKAMRGDLAECIARLDASGADLELIDLAKAALADDPDDRMRDAGELSAGITEYLEGVQDRLKETEFARVEAETRSEEQRRRKKLYLALAGMMMILAVGGAVFAALFKRKADTEQQLAQSESQRADDEKKNAAEQTGLKDTAIVQRKFARESAFRSDIARLAAESDRVRAETAQLSVLLAMAAVEIGQSNDLGPVPDAHGALLRATSSIGGVSLGYEDGMIWRLLVSADNHLFRKRDGTIHVCDLGNTVPANAWVKLEMGNGESDTPIATGPKGRTLITVNGTTNNVWQLNERRDRATLISALPTGSGWDAAAISHDGRWVATLGHKEIGVTTLWDLHAADPSQSAVELGRLGATKNARPEFKTTFSANGRWLVSVHASGALFWDLSAENPAESQIRLKHDVFRSSVAINSGSRWLAIGTAEGTRLFDLLEENIVSSERKLPGKHVTMSQDGRWMFTASEVVRRFDLDATNPLLSVVVFKGSWGIGAVSPSNRWLVTLTDNVAQARIWDLQSVDFSTLPIMEYSGIRERAWDPETNSNIGVSHVISGHDNKLKALVFSPDGRTLLTGGWNGHIRAWNLESENPASATILKGHKDGVGCVAISPDGHWIVTGSFDQTIRLWNLTASHPAASSIVLRGHRDGVVFAEFSPDSRWLVTASGFRGFAPMENPDVREALVWDLSAPDPSKSSRILSGHQDTLRFIKMGPNSRLVATASNDQTVRVWDLFDPDAKPHVLVHNGQLNDVVFSPDGNSVYTCNKVRVSSRADGDPNAALRRWNLSMPDPLVPTIIFESEGRALEEHSVLRFALGPGNPRVITGGWLNPTRIWDLKTLEPTSLDELTFRELPTGAHGVFRTREISSNGKWFGTVDGVWDLIADDENSLPLVLHTHTSQLAASAFSPRGDRFSTTDQVGVAMVSNLLAEDPPATTLVLRGHPAPRGDIAISPDSNWAVTASSDDTARLWELNLNTLMKRARKLVDRELTDQERQRFGILKAD